MSAVQANDRYEVEVIGTPDPEGAQYMVLNVVHDNEARIVLWKLVRQYEYAGQPARAAEVRRVLEESKGGHAAAMAARNALFKEEKKRGAAKKDRRA